MKRIKTPVGYGFYDVNNHLWLLTHKNKSKNDSIKCYNIQHSKYHYSNVIEEDEDDEVMKNICKVANQDLLPIDHINYLEYL